MDNTTTVTEERFQRELERRLQPTSVHASVAATDRQLQESCDALNAAWPEIGRLPPSPATWRGRLGARLILAIQRALFWYTPQIQGYQYLVAKAFQQLAAALSQARAENAQLTQRVADLQQTVDALRESVAKLEQRNG